MMLVQGLVLVICLILFAIAFVVIFKKQSQAQVAFLQNKIREEMESNQKQFLLLAKEQFLAEQNKASGELEVKKQAVESWVNQLKSELKQYQQMVRELENDRSVKFGHLENELKNASLATQRLSDTTSHLTNVLGNVKLRGQWGERMAEDIIRYAGLVEGVNYQKQKKMDSTTTKPDYTFFLPNGHKVNMDAKFPLDNYMRMVNAQDALEKEAALKEFSRNVKERVKEIQNREYINPEDNTLDFVILFIPNEQVFGFIQEKMPDIMETALSQKVVISSPFTLYAMLSVIRQAHENFRYENDIKKIILLVEQFVGLYERFKERFDDLGKNIDKMQTLYADIKLKNFQQLDTKIRHIEDYKKGNPQITDQPVTVLPINRLESQETHVA